jgi:hypothetical protein
MSRSLSEQIEALQGLNLAIRHQLESAEAYVPGINDAVERLINIGLLDRTMLLGDVIFQAAYNPKYGREDSAILLQACLGVGHGGIGVIVWDLERYWEFVRFNQPLTHDIEINFEPFQNCPNAIKGLLLPHLQPLVTRVCRMAGA